MTAASFPRGGGEWPQLSATPSLLPGWAQGRPGQGTWPCQARSGVILEPPQPLLRGFQGLPLPAEEANPREGRAGGWREKTPGSARRKPSLEFCLSKLAVM